MPHRRPPWWMYLVAASYVGFVALYPYEIFHGPFALPGFEGGFRNGSMVVFAVHPESAEARAGLEQGDRIIEVNAKIIRNVRDWESIRANTEIGRPQQWEIDRAGKRLELTVEFHRHPATDTFSTHFVLAGAYNLFILTSLILGLLVAFRRPYDPIARVGAWVLVTAAGTFGFPDGWAATWRHLPPVLSLFLWIPEISRFVPDAILLSFFLIFPRKVFRSRWPWLVIWAPALALVPWRVKGIYEIIYSPWTDQMVPGWVFTAVSLRHVVYLVASLLVLVLSYRKLTDANQRRRVRFVLAGVMISTLGVVGWIAIGSARSLSFWHRALEVPLYAMWLAFPVSFAFAILRHRMFDLGVMIRQGVQYALARGLVLSLVPLLGVVLVADLLMHGERPLVEVLAARGWVYAALGGLAFLAHSQRNRWMELLDRRFFRERYDAQRLLREIVEEILRAGSLERVGPRVVASIEAALHPEFAALLTMSPGELSYRCLCAAPAGQAPPPLPADSKLAALIRMLGKPLETPHTESGWLQRQLPREETDFLRKARIDLLLPIATAPSGIQALLMLGVKKSEEPYSSEDLDLLEAIGASLALLVGRPPHAEVRPSEPFEECPECGACYDSGSSRCKKDNSRLQVTRLPRLLAGRYRFDRRRGRGGMGLVYQAEDTKLHRQVALKFLPEEFARDRQALQRFHREAYAASALNHPNICTIHDIDEYEGQPYIAMELLEGQTVRDRLGGKALTKDEVIDLAIQITDALEAAHSKGIIHRDIKPANIMVTERGQVKVLDFGLAKLAHEGVPEAGSGSVQESAAPSTAAASGPLDSLTRAGMAVGTPAYMSPEQITAKDLDQRTDLFSLGLVLYEMATRQRAFEGESPGAVLEKILIHTPPPPSRTNPEFSPAFDDIVRKLLEKERELRYQTAADVLADLKHERRESDSVYGATLARAQAKGISLGEGSRRSWSPLGWLGPLRRLSAMARLDFAAGLVLILALGAGVLYWRSHRGPQLTEKDSILVTDFVNITGDSIFDHILKQALAIKLSESPFLNIFPEDRVRETLTSMNRSPDERVTAAIGREICARQGIKAIITGQIASLGSHYVITLDALNSRTGESLAQQQVEATSKEGVLAALGEASSKLRKELGESLSSLEQFDTPIQQATTSSLEAFTAFNMGVEQSVRKGSELEGIPFLKRAIELDPDFAMAYSVLASRYANLGEGQVAAEYARQAFQLRERASEREKFIISARYYASVTGEVDKEIETCLLWKQLYPRDAWAHVWLGVSYGDIGQYQKALEEFLEVQQLAPDDAYSYFNLGWVYLCLNRFAESKAIYSQALAKNFDVFTVHERLYLIAFVEGDTEAMRRHAAWAVGNPEEYGMLSLQAATEAYFGKLRKARDLWRRAAELAEHAGLKENAAAITAYEALIEASYGNLPQARDQTAKAMALARTRDVMWAEAAALGVSGDVTKGEAFAQDSARQFPKDTLVHAVYVPFLQAGLELQRGDSAQAIEALQAAIPYERAFWQVLFLRGQAYLKAGAGSEAAAQFQRMMEYRGGLRVNHPWQALAHLYLGRAWAMAGDKGKSRLAYEDFLALWKNADPDIPIFQQAKAEYAKLQ